MEIHCIRWWGNAGKQTQRAAAHLVREVLQDRRRPMEVIHEVSNGVAVLAGHLLSQERETIERVKNVPRIGERDGHAVAQVDYSRPEVGEELVRAVERTREILQRVLQRRPDAREHCVGLLDRGG